ncbi:Mad3/BUB1 homology region 1-domain-containing protein [Phellopilus nigrolimitatus]|nr:Mad3/BUB1 homology region 1-domain-containing protein [Phellopilus nigrolimitatus]
MSGEYDEEESANVIVDCDILEAAKENIQPLAGGRRATALASVLATPHGQRDARFAATKARLRESVREAQAHVDKLAAQAEDGERVDDEDEDSGDEDELTLEDAEELLLDAYVRLVTWTVEHYPRGQSAESGILELLEEATRVMRHSAFAKADARYLNLWVRYATYVDKPEVIFEFLLVNEIGTGWAKLYEEYAGVLEKSNRRTKADETYLLGIARKVEPLDRLERRHRDFQKRMMVSAPVPASESSDTFTVPATSASVESVPRRRVLGESTSSLSTSSSLVSASSSRRSPLSTTPTHDVFSAPSSSSSLASVGARPNGRMPIFVDPTGTAAEAASGNAWPELGTRKERIKENVRGAEKMQGAVLKQRGASRAATRDASTRARGAPKIVPYKDPEPAPTGGSTGTGIRGPTKIVPFRDPECVSPAGGSASTSARLLPKTPAKGAFTPFVDTVEENASKAKPSVPATPRFVPFKDEPTAETPAPTSATLPVPESVMRLKPVGGSGPSGASSEAEALRKDPFKNYKDL